MSGTPEIEFFGNTVNGLYAGHAYVNGQPIAGVMLRLPQDSSPAVEEVRGPGRPSGKDPKRLQRDIKTMAARDIVKAVLKRDGRKAKMPEIMAIVIAAAREAAWQDDFGRTIERASNNDAQFRRRIREAKKEIFGAEIKVDVTSKDPENWTWAAVCRDGRAWLYFWGGEIIECVAHAGSKPGNVILKAAIRERTK